jgi:hypothetical protein
VVVPGQLPNGCVPIILTLYASKSRGDYDARGCLKKQNALARYHNSALFEAVSRLRHRYPWVKIVYADYYKPVIDFLKKPARFGECVVNLAVRFISAILFGISSFKNY